MMCVQAQTTEWQTQRCSVNWIVTSYILSPFTSSSPEPNSFHLAMNYAAEVDRKHLISCVSTEHTGTLPAAQTDSLIIIKPLCVHTEDSRPKLHLLVTGLFSFCHAWVPHFKNWSHSRNPFVNQLFGTGDEFSHRNDIKNDGWVPRQLIKCPLILQ